MSFLRKIFGGGPGDARDEGLYLYVRCDRCGEVVRVRVNPANDLSPVYEGDSDDPEGYELNKEIMGNKCFNLMRGTWRFDKSKRITGREVIGGKEISREEYEAETAAQTS